MLILARAEARVPEQRSVYCGTDKANFTPRQQDGLTLCGGCGVELKHIGRDEPVVPAT
jgi:hypothetical protein